MTVLDRIRIERAVLAYDFWLDLRGTPARRRRDLRRELRANLRDASAHTGARTAVAALGGIRRMAADAGAEDRTHARWAAGLNSGVAAVGLTLLVAFLSATAWTDGVLSSDPDAPVTGSVTLLPGSSLSYEPLGDGFSFSFTPGWAPALAGLLVFVLVARPWRAVGARRGTAQARYTST